MSQFNIIAAAALVTLLAGCQTPQLNAPAGGAVDVMTAARVAASFVHVNAVLQVTAPAGYQLTALTAWSKTNIDHVDLTLFKDDGAGTFVATGATKTIAGANLAEAVNLGNLKMGTRYKVVARAYADADGTNAIDDIAAFGSDANCSVIFTTPSLVTAADGDSIDDDAMAITIPVRLLDKIFAGTATSANGVVVTHGSIVDTTTNESF